MILGISSVASFPDIHASWVHKSQYNGIVCQVSLCKCFKIPSTVNMTTSPQFILLESPSVVVKLSAILLRGHAIPTPFGMTESTNFRNFSGVEITSRIQDHLALSFPMKTQHSLPWTHWPLYISSKQINNGALLGHSCESVLWWDANHHITIEKAWSQTATCHCVHLMNYILNR